MRYGSVSGINIPISIIVLGTSGLQNSEKADPILDAFVEAGGTCLDTAHVYGGGQSETTVGSWIRRRRIRDRLVLIGKGAHPPNCRPEDIAPQLKESLDRLGVSYIDLYMLHRDDKGVPVAEFVDAVGREMATKRIRSFGVSNWCCQRIEEANAYTKSSNNAKIIAVSNQFSLATMIDPLYPGCLSVNCAEDREWFINQQLPLFPWSSQARGFFAPGDQCKLNPQISRCFFTEENLRRRSRARVLAEEKGVSPVNIACAFVLAQPFPTFPIIGPQTLDELRIALQALRVDLSPDESQWLEEGHQAQNHSGTTIISTRKSTDNE